MIFSDSAWFIRQYERLSIRLKQNFDSGYTILLSYQNFVKSPAQVNLFSPVYRRTLN